MPFVECKNACDISTNVFSCYVAYFWICWSIFEFFRREQRIDVECSGACIERQALYISPVEEDPQSLVFDALEIYGLLAGFFERSVESFAEVGRHARQ